MGGHALGGGASGGSGKGPPQGGWTVSPEGAKVVFAHLHREWEEDRSAVARTRNDDLRGGAVTLWGGGRGDGDSRHQEDPEEDLSTTGFVRAMGGRHEEDAGNAGTHEDDADLTTTGFVRAMSDARTQQHDAALSISGLVRPIRGRLHDENARELEGAQDLKTVNTTAFVYIVREEEARWQQREQQQSRFPAQGGKGVSRSGGSGGEGAALKAPLSRTHTHSHTPTHPHSPRRTESAGRPPSCALEENRGGVSRFGGGSSASAFSTPVPRETVGLLPAGGVSKEGLLVLRSREAALEEGLVARAQEVRELREQVLYSASIKALLRLD